MRPLHTNDLCTTSGVVTLSGEERPSPLEAIQLLEEKLARADEAIRRKEQLIQAMRQQVSLVTVYM